MSIEPAFKIVLEGELVDGYLFFAAEEAWKVAREFWKERQAAWVEESCHDIS